MDGLTDRMVPRGSMTTIPSTAAFSAASNQRASPSVPLKAGGRPAPPLVSSSVELIGRDHNPTGKDRKDIKDLRDTKVPPDRGFVVLDVLGVFEVLGVLGVLEVLEVCQLYKRAYGPAGRPGMNARAARRPSSSGGPLHRLFCRAGSFACSAAWRCASAAG